MRKKTCGFAAPQDLNASAAQAAGGLAELGAKGAGQGRRAGKSCAQGDFGQGMAGVGQHAAGGGEAQGQGIGGGCQGEVGAE